MAEAEELSRGRVTLRFMIASDKRELTQVVIQPSTECCSRVYGAAGLRVHKITLDRRQRHIYPQFLLPENAVAALSSTSVQRQARKQRVHVTLRFA